MSPRQGGFAVPITPRRASNTSIAQNNQNATNNFLTDESGNKIKMFVPTVSNRPYVNADLEGIIFLSSYQETIKSDKSRYKGSMMEANVKMRNPYIVNEKGPLFKNSTENGKAVDVAKIIKDLKAKGYDGIIFDKEPGDCYAVIAFNRGQIVEAESDTSVEDVRYQVRDNWRPSHEHVYGDDLEHVRKVAMERASQSGNDIDSTTKWLYTNRKGKVLFAIYSTENYNEENGVPPTILYASGNTDKKSQADNEYDWVIEKVKEWGSIHDDESRKAFAKGLKNLGGEFSRGSGNHGAARNRGSSGRNAVVYEGPRGFKPSRALRNCLENIFKDTGGRGVRDGRVNETVNTTNDEQYQVRNTDKKSQADNEYDWFKNCVLGGRTINGWESDISPTTFREMLGAIEHEFTKKSSSNGGTGDRGSGGRNATVYTGPSGFRPSRALLSCLRNCGQTSERTDGVNETVDTTNDEQYQVRNTDDSLYTMRNNPRDAYYMDSSVYNYDSLVKQPNMNVVKIPDVKDIKNSNDWKINRDTVVSLGEKNASENAEFFNDGKKYVKNVYTGINLRIDKSSIKHGLNGGANRLRTNGRLGAVIGDLVKNAIPINGLKNDSNSVIGTYAMAAFTKGTEANYVAIITVEQRSGNVENVDIVDVTHSVNGRINNIKKKM